MEHTPDLLVNNFIELAGVVRAGSLLRPASMADPVEDFQPIAEFGVVLMRLRVGLEQEQQVVGSSTGIAPEPSR